MLKPRERNLLIVTLIVLGGGVLYWFAGLPWWAARKQLVVQQTKLTSEQARAKAVLETDERAHATWAQIRRGGLKSDLSETETQLVATLQNWAQQSGLRLSSSRRERVMPVKLYDLQELVYQVTYTGSMGGVRGFLYRLETTDQPLRVHRLDITSPNEGQDSLRLQLTISMLCSGTQPSPAPAPVAAPTPQSPAAPTTQKGGQS